MSPHGFSYMICDFATNKTEKKYEVSQNTELSNDKISAFFYTTTHTKKITDWITSQKPICRRHPINLNNNIKDISQKKDLPKSANDTIIYRLSLWYKQWKVEVAYSTMQPDSTLDAPKNFLNDNRQNSHSTRSKIMYKYKSSWTKPLSWPVLDIYCPFFQKGRNTKCFRVKSQ